MEKLLYILLASQAVIIVLVSLLLLKIKSKSNGNDLGLKVNFLDEKLDEIERKITEKMNNQYTDIFTKLKENEDAKPENWDVKELYSDVEEYVKEVKMASASLLQRHFRIGYARAAQLIDLLEKKGVIGPHNGTTPREVYTDEDELE